MKVLPINSYTDWEVKLMIWKVKVIKTNSLSIGAIKALKKTNHFLKSK